MLSIAKVIMLSVLLRVGLLFYGNYHDIHHSVKYTDIDYQVYTEAATFMSEGESPYKSLTYRYTPALALLLLPNVYWNVVWGKIVFSAFDILTGYLIHSILNLHGWSPDASTWGAILWLFNPVAFTVSTRGNAEPLLTSLVLLVLYCRKKEKIVQCAVFFGLSIHMKIYPIIFSLPLYLNLGRVIELDPRKSSTMFLLFKMTLLKLCPNSRQAVFALVTVGTFLGVSALCYSHYGDHFLQQTYLYHVSRRDIRHNFSLYYYMFYLTVENVYYSRVLSVFAFMPQVLLLLKSSICYHGHLEFVFFLNTAIFVTFNKVVTSQYFLWHLSLLPLIVSRLDLKRSEASVLTVLWTGNQAAWLLSAYLLEFRGRPTHLCVLFSSVAFFLTNCYIMRFFIKKFHFKTEIKYQDENSPKRETDSQKPSLKSD